MRRRTHITLATTAALAAALPVAAAHGAAKLVVSGHGFGHGVGMSQYGAYGYARHGTAYEEILGHYYTGTKLRTLPKAPAVGVLLAGGRTRASFSGATRAGGRRLSAAQTYTAAPGPGGGVVLLSRTGRTLAKAGGALRVTAPSGAPLRLGSSRYRGALEFRRTAAGAVNVINSLDVENYVRGVVAAESPSSWPQNALRAQAVAARTYALTTDAGSKADGFTQYPDTRSQVYRGVSAETASTDEAVKATHLQVVTYAGKPVTTYFFSTSGGRTENIENSFIGAAPQPYLKSVDDPYDDVSPRHNWGPISFTSAQVDAKLSGVLKGTLEEIRVTKRGVSPRVVSAQVIGTGGTTTVSGAELRRRLGLYDTWATFTVPGSGTPSTTSQPPRTPTTPALPGDPASGGVGPR